MISYVRTHFIVTDLILNGDLVEAVTLIRKQLESVARLNELDQRPLHKLEGKTPNIRMFFEHGGGEMYGHLSEVAHFSKPRVSELMRGIGLRRLPRPQRPCAAVQPAVSRAHIRRRILTRAVLRDGE